MTADQLASVAGIILSLCFSYIPGVRQWHDKQTPEIKRLIMAACLFVVAAGAFGLSCGGIVNYVTCDKAGAVGLVSAFISALIANQAAFLITKVKA